MTVSLMPRLKDRISDLRLSLDRLDEAEENEKYALESMQRHVRTQAKPGEFAMWIREFQGFQEALRIAEVRSEGCRRNVAQLARVLVVDVAVSE